MDESRHSLFIGAFVLGALVIGFSTALFFAAGGVGGDKQRVVMVFDGSVKGLAIGAPVALRGVQIGQVTDIQIMLDQERADFAMVVVAELDGSRVQSRGQRDGIAAGDHHPYLIERGLRAQLQTQSVLTGLLLIQLDFHPGTPVNYVAVDQPYPQIPTVPTELQALRQTLQSIDYSELIEAAQAIAGSLRAFVENEDFRALPGDLRLALGALQNAGRGIGGLQPELSTALVAVAGAADAVSSSLPALGTGLSDALQGLDQALLGMEGVMRSVENQLAPGSPMLQQLDAALIELSRAGRALHGFMQMLEAQPDALLRGRRAGEKP